MRGILGDRYYIPLTEGKQRYEEMALICRDSRWTTSLQRLRSYNEKHKGQRCFILGNGPSLARMDLSALKNEMTFGMNRIYLMFDRMGFETTYHITINRYVIEQCAKEIAALSSPKFINWESRDLIDFTPNMMFLASDPQPGFHIDVTKSIWEGSTVTFAALQVAYYMGFQTVILIGVDHSFESKGKPHELVVSTGDDPNHFDPKYFGKGFRWQLPDLETSELAYRLARYQFDCSGRQVLDATVDGKLQIFQKARFEDLVC